MNFLRGNQSFSIKVTRPLKRKRPGSDAWLHTTSFTRENLQTRVIITVREHTIPARKHRWALTWEPHKIYLEYRVSITHADQEDLSHHANYVGGQVSLTRD